MAGMLPPVSNAKAKRPRADIVRFYLVQYCIVSYLKYALTL